MVICKQPNLDISPPDNVLLGDSYVRALVNSSVGIGALCGRILPWQDVLQSGCRFARITARLAFYASQPAKDR
jgi:hypothetical protein